MDWREDSSRQRTKGIVNERYRGLCSISKVVMSYPMEEEMEDKQIDKTLESADKLEADLADLVNATNPSHSHVERKEAHSTLDAAHTPAPWGFKVHNQAIRITLKAPHWEVGSGAPADGGKGIAFVFGDNEADARLVAAAPTLYEALKHALETKHDIRTCACGNCEDARAALALVTESK